MAANVLEGIVGKASIAAVVLEDADAMLLGKVFKCALNTNHFFRGQFHHQMDILELEVVVDGDCHRGVILLGECSLELGNEANLC